MPHHPLNHRRLVVLAVILLIVLGVSTSPVLGGAVREMLATVERVIRAYPRAGVAVFLAFAAVSAMLSFFSSTPIVPVGVYVWGTERTMLLLWIGGVVGGTGGYWLARTLGRRVALRFIPAEPFHRYETFFASRARWPSILLFRFALQSELPSYVLGVLKYPFPKYLPIMALAELPFVAVVVYLGDAFVRGRSGLFVVTLAASLGFTLLAFRRLQREMRAG